MNGIPSSRPGGISIGLVVETIDCEEIASPVRREEEDCFIRSTNQSTLYWDKRSFLLRVVFVGEFSFCMKWGWKMDGFLYVGEFSSATFESVSFWGKGRKAVHYTILSVRKIAYNQKSRMDVGFHRLLHSRK